jgi:hypothetical protein
MVGSRFTEDLDLNRGASPVVIKLAERLYDLSFRTPVYFTGVRNLLCLKQQQIPHFVRDDSFSSFSANCEAATHKDYV